MPSFDIIVGTYGACSATEPDIQLSLTNRTTVEGQWRTLTLGVACIRRRCTHSLFHRHVCPLLVTAPFPQLQPVCGTTLPAEVTSSSLLPTFERQLKTVLFEWSFPNSSVQVLTFCLHVFTCITGPPFRRRLLSATVQGV